MRVLILGCGYVGLPLGQALVGQGHEVHAVRRRPDTLDELEAAGLHPHAADLTRRETLDTLPGSFDWILHTASSSRGDADVHRAVFVDGTENLIDWLTITKAHSRLLFTSSTSVYPQTDGGWVDEECPDKPVAGTGKNLAVAEEMFLEWPAGATVLRVAGIYGPGRGYLYRQFLKDEAMLDGDGNRWLNMIHRADVVGAILCAMENEPGIYNVADDEPVTQHDFFAWLSELLGKPMPPAGSRAPGKRARTHKRVANERLRALGWQLKYPTFREGYSALRAAESANAK